MTVNDLIEELQALPVEQRAMEACVFSLDTIRPITKPVAEECETCDAREYAVALLAGDRSQLPVRKVMVIS